ncbi:hypothetical protein [Muricoccus nepalensis]|uniref:hypothetical protein n=1 Tax=Muricoccus nepalensis TaxID=1854500 RepID=UPI0019D4F58D|nr:hypothetical protein [Roseomonas nepalensis]
MDGVEVERTPLLVPSFSSKGFPDVAKVVAATSEVIDGPALVSAYDLWHKKVEPPFDFAPLLFLDSGGYEAGRDVELSDVGDREHSPRPWSRDKHEEVLAGWTPAVPSVLISYDHPDERLPVADQIDRARSLAPGRKGIAREILLKPETTQQRFLQMDTLLQPKHVRALGDFDVIGVTEKEVGNSLLDRMRNIAHLRRAIDGVGLEQIPIHIFGSLDTVSTPLYFLAGADIFDGLTWLRYAFHRGLTIYRHNYAALDLGLNTRAHVVDGRCWFSNYYYMKDMELEMRRFLSTGDFASFEHHSDLFRKAHESLLEALEG